jgi:hypothetical protein
VDWRCAALLIARREDDRFVTTNEFAVSVINNASRLNERERMDVLTICDSVCNEIWVKSPMWFRQHGADLFPADADILIVSDKQTAI